MAAAILEGQGSSRGKSQGAGGGPWVTPQHHATPHHTRGFANNRASWEPMMKVICLIHDPRGALRAEICLRWIYIKIEYFLRRFLQCLLSL